MRIGATRLMVLAAVLLVGLRLVNLEADFPAAQLTNVPDPYNDEGLWLNNAISLAVRGEWHVEGDHNPAVTTPVVPLIEAGVFQIAGLGLGPARVVAVAFFALAALVLFGLVRRYAPRSTAALAALLFSANFVLFAFSRIVLLDIPMMALALASLLLAVTAERRPWRLLLAALGLVLAVLTKTTGWFALPVLLYGVWTGGGCPRSRGKAMALLAAVAAALVLVYSWAASTSYPDDYRYINSFNIEKKLPRCPLEVADNLARSVLRFGRVDPVMAVLTAAGLLALWSDRQLRSLPLVALCGVWWVAWTGTLGLSHYQPTRYYLPYLVPLVVLFSLIASRLWERGRRWTAAVLVGAVLFVNLARTGLYLARPVYSFRDMAWDVTRTARREAGPRAVLLGECANTISLATGIPAINDGFGPRDLGWKLARYRPTHYVCLQEERKEKARLERVRRLEPRAAYDVFENFWRGEPLRLYRIAPLD